VGSADHVVHFGPFRAHYFSCSGGPGSVSIKSTPGHVITNLCFLRPVVYADHIVHSGASGTRNVNAIFFMLEWDRYRFNKKCAETRYAKLVFCIWWDLRVSYCIPMCAGHETLMHYF
jgi:hypothetical protein